MSRMRTLCNAIDQLKEESEKTHSSLPHYCHQLEYH